MKTTKTNAGKRALIIIAVILILIIALTVGGAIAANAYTNGGESTAKAYLKYNGNVYEGDGEIVLPYEGEANIDVCRAGFGKKVPQFEVHVLPNAATDFTYTDGDSLKRFSDVGELTAAFRIEIRDGAFTISCAPKEYNVLNVIQRVTGADVNAGELPERNYLIIEVIIDGTRINLAARQKPYQPVTDITPPTDVDFIN